MHRVVTIIVDVLSIATGSAARRLGSSRITVETAHRAGVRSSARGREVARVAATVAKGIVFAGSCAANVDRAACRTRHARGGIGAVLILVGRTHIALSGGSRAVLVRANRARRASLAASTTLESRSTRQAERLAGRARRGSEGISITLVTWRRRVGFRPRSYRTNLAGRDTVHRQIGETGSDSANARITSGTRDASSAILVGIRSGPALGAVRVIIVGSKLASTRIVLNHGAVRTRGTRKRTSGGLVLVARAGWAEGLSSKALERSSWAFRACRSTTSAVLALVALSSVSGVGPADIRLASRSVAVDALEVSGGTIDTKV